MVNSMRELRPHQEKAVEMLRDSLRQGLKRPVLAAPCSFGKTTVASHLIQNAVAKGKRCYFIVDRVELIDQASERFTEDGIDHGVMQGDHPMTDPTKQVQVATIQTISRRRTQDFDFGIIDECHVLHKTHIDYMKAYDNIPFIGLSATPFAKGMGNHFNNLIVPITTGELMDKGYLCEYDCYAPTEPDLKGVRIKRGDYDEEGLAKVMDAPKLVGDLVATHQELAKGRPTVVFAVNIAHSRHICQEFRKVGVKAVHVDAYTDKDTRKMINEQFKKGDIDLLSCVAIFEKGWDAPIASCLIQAAPTKSIMRYVQQVGRILRTYPGKDRAIILDHAGNTTRHGWVESIFPYRLDDGEKSDTPVVKREKKKQEPQRCEKCGYVKETFICSACGYKPEYAKNVALIDGDLEKKSKKEKVSTVEKERWYAMFLGHANQKGYSKGWAYFKTREKFGASLSKNKHIQPITPDQECLNWIKHINIKHAKGKAKYAAGQQR
jgi:superfamily II DNA or RNA helicase